MAAPESIDGQLNGPVECITAAVRILVVDDDECMRDYLREALTGQGFETLQASSGEEAVRIYRRERVSIVLLDIFMPEKDGFETLMDIRRYCPDAKIIAMSGHAEYRGINVLNWAQKLGAQACVLKPFTLDQLAAAVQTALETPV